MAPLRDSDYCLSHDPQHAEEAQEARRLGGLRRRRERTVSAAYDFEGLATVPDIRRIVEIAVVDTFSLENSVARNRTLAALAQVSVSLLEKGEWEERVEAIEAAVGPRLLQQPRRARGR
jgi:hypothetical protein